MVVDIYYFTISAFLFAVFIASIWLSFQGRALARYFLWSWAVLLLLAVVTPFTSLDKKMVTAHVAGVAFLFFFYTLFLFNKRNRHQLDIAHDEIRRVLAESNKRMDDERRRISRRLHDDINPKLVIAKLELEQLEFLIRSIGGGEQAEKIGTIIKKLMSSIGDIYQDSREIIKNTRIEVIDSIGLTAAIESLVNHYNGVLEKTDIALKHNLPRRPVLPSDASINAYRIIQEALLNAVKHAEASSVAVGIRQAGRRYSVTIVDDGVGIAKKSTQGIGLIDMRERARLLGGELKIETPVKGGTKISFSFLHPDSSN